MGTCMLGTKEVVVATPVSSARSTHIRHSEGPVPLHASAHSGELGTHLERGSHLARQWHEVRGKLEAHLMREAIACHQMREAIACHRMREVRGQLEAHLERPR